MKITQLSFIQGQHWVLSSKNDKSKTILVQKIKEAKEKREHETAAEFQEWCNR